MKNKLPIIDVEMHDFCVVAGDCEVPDLVSVVERYSNDNKRIEIRAVVQAELLSLHFQKNTMRIRVIPSNKYSFAGIHDISADAFFNQYKIVTNAVAANDAQELRNKAFELLNHAEAMDGLKPSLLVCNGGYDEPTTTVVWSEQEMTSEKTASVMGFENEDGIPSEYEFYQRQLSLIELLSNVCRN